MYIRDFKGILEDIRYIVSAPVVNLMLLFGFLLLVISFLKFDGITAFSFVRNPNWVMLIIGIVLLIGGPVIFVITREDRRINKRATIQKGISFSFNGVSVNLKVGKIQEIPQLSKNSAVVLPANTAFIDDCITDEKSALGAFFLKFYPDRIPDVSKVMEEQLQQQGYQKDNSGFYPLGATIILPPAFDTPAKCIITASTIRKEQVGIRAEPSGICECIKQMFMITSDKKIEKLYMPILGSGHGGLEINDALRFLVLAIKYYSQFFHHIRSVEVVVTETDAPRLKDVYRLQYMMLLEARKKQ